MKKKISEETKVEIVSLFNKGMKGNNIINMYSISKSSLYNWAKQYTTIESKERTVTAKHYYNLQQKYDKLKSRIEIYNSTDCTPASNREKRIQAILTLRNDFSLHALCDTFNIPRATIYHYIRRDGKSASEIKDENLKVLILDIFNKSKERLGAKKIKAKLNEEGISISVKRIVRLMKEMNIKCKIYKKKRVYVRLNTSKEHENKLKQRFYQEFPNNAWVSDITYLNIGKERYYLCAIIDLFSRKVISYIVSNDMTVTLVISVFMTAFNSRGNPKELLFHSDCGGQYISTIFKQLLKELGVEQSFSSPGYPYDNAVIESFFRSMKTEELYKYNYNSIDELNIIVDEYIEYYNDYRPHKSLNNKTPNQFEKEYEK